MNVLRRLFPPLPLSMAGVVLCAAGAYTWVLGPIWISYLCFGLCLVVLVITALTRTPRVVFWRAGVLGISHALLCMACGLFVWGIHMSLGVSTGGDYTLRIPLGWTAMLIAPFLIFGLVGAVVATSPKADAEATSASI